MRNGFYKNKNIAITGAAGGLGKEFVFQLHDLGANIFSIISRSSGDRHIKSASKAIHRCDFTSNEDIEELTKKDFFNEIDILINCAGAWLLETIEEINLSDYDKIMNINVKAPFALSTRCARSMKNKKKGIIVNIGSSSSYNGCGDAGAYSTSKHALLGMSRSLAKSLKKHDIKVLMYSPGSIQTKMGKQDFRQDFNTFLDPQKVAEYIIYATSLSDDMIIDESRINRISIS